MSRTDNSDTRTSEILKKVRQVEIRTNRMVTEALSGAYHSVFKGRGMDFEEVREYQPGDDVRTIDWNVTAKMDRPFVKLFREERELTLVLAVDLSGSGDFGSSGQSKRELAAEIASVLAFSATSNNDKVGLLLFTDTVEQFIPPRKGRQHILRVIREILFFKPKRKGTDIHIAVDTLNRMLKRKAALFVLSDFIEAETSATATITKADTTTKAGTVTKAGIASLPQGLDSAVTLSERTLRTLRLCAERHDLTAVVINDRHEFALPDVGLLLLEDAESGEVVELNSGSFAVREAYAQANAERRQALGRALRQSGVGILHAETDKPYIGALRRYFETRRSRSH